MIVRYEDWERIREQFTEAEKKQLRKVVTGQVICPRGWTIDEEKAPELAAKIRAAVTPRL